MLQNGNVSLRSATGTEACWLALTSIFDHNALIADCFNNEQLDSNHQALRMGGRPTRHLLRRRLGIRDGTIGFISEALSADRSDDG